MMQKIHETKHAATNINMRSSSNYIMGSPKWFH